MNTLRKIFTILFCAAIVCIAGGCVERELTVKTIPDGAMVELNDEQIGISPVTVPFNWYGTYRVRMEKEGYQTLVVNQKLDRPASDYFPLDLLRDMFTPDALDSYEWTFEMSPYERPDREQLIKNALDTQEKTALAVEEMQAKIDANK